MWLGFRTSEEMDIVYNALLKYTDNIEMGEVEGEYRVCIYTPGLSFTDSGHGLLITLPTTGAYGVKSADLVDGQPRVSVDLHFMNVHVEHFCTMRS